MILVNQFKNSGNYQVVLDLENFDLSSGVYFYKIEMANFIEVKKLLFMK